MRYAIPSAFEELQHTADVGVRVRGSDLAEAYARAALAMAQLQAGGGEVAAVEERSVVAAGEDPVTLLVDFCRQVLGVFFASRLLLAAVEIRALSEQRLEARCQFGPFDGERHAEGVDVKAVTYARATIGPAPEGGFEAMLIFDI